MRFAFAALLALPVIAAADEPQAVVKVSETDRFGQVTETAVEVKASILVNAYEVELTNRRTGKVWIGTLKRVRASKSGGADWYAVDGPAWPAGTDVKVSVRVGGMLRSEWQSYGTYTIKR